MLIMNYLQLKSFSVKGLGLVMELVAKEAIVSRIDNKATSDLLE